jgi:hypothetical protein
MFTENELLPHTEHMENWRSVLDATVLHHGTVSREDETHRIRILSLVSRVSPQGTATRTTSDHPTATQATVPSNKLYHLWFNMNSNRVLKAIDNGLLVICLLACLLALLSLPLRRVRLIAVDADASVVKVGLATPVRWQLFRKLVIFPARIQCTSFPLRITRDVTSS